MAIFTSCFNLIVSVYLFFLVLGYVQSFELNCRGYYDTLFLKLYHNEIEALTVAFSLPYINVETVPRFVLYICCCGTYFVTTDFHWQYLLNEVANNCYQIATDKSGCCALQQCVDHSKGEARSHLVREIIANALHLSENQYGCVLL